MVRTRISSTAGRLFRRSIFRNQTETRLGLVPKGVDPRGGLRQARRVQHVNIARALGAMGDEARPLELREMAGDGRTADRKQSCQFADAARPLGEGSHELPALRIAEGFERGI